MNKQNENINTQKEATIKELKKLIENVESGSFDEQNLFNMYPFIEGWNNNIFSSLEDPIRLLFLGYHVDDIYKNMKKELKQN